MSKSEDIPELEHVFILGEGGSIFKMDLPLHETISERLLKGYLTRVNEDGSTYVEGQSAVKIAALPTERPAISAGKKVWVGWAVAQGMTPDDAEAATKTDLIEKFGTAPAAPAAPEAPAVLEGTEAPAAAPGSTEDESAEDDAEGDEPEANADGSEPAEAPATE